MFAFLAFSGTTSISAQSIIVDSAFTTDTQIYPFSQVDTIYGLNISGTVQLNSDTSLVRVIVSDGTGLEWMAYESYPMIGNTGISEIFQECDETCFLDTFMPQLLKIQIINGVLQIDSLNFSDINEGDLSALQYQAKRSKDLQKIERMNSNIDSLGMIWVSGDNWIVQQYYKDKIHLLGYKYNQMGFDYYMGGIFDLYFGKNLDPTISNLTDNFDWRTRHNAHRQPVPNNPYYDGPNGWLTTVRTQECNHCWVFAPLHQTEAMVNLYFNRQLDLNLSEQQLASCVDQDDTCDGGSAKASLSYIQQHGVVEEECFEYGTVHPPSAINVPCSLKCTIPSETIGISGSSSLALSIDSFKRNLIENGPYYTCVEALWHYMLLVGFGRVKDGDTIYTDVTGLEDPIIINSEDGTGTGYIGMNYWIFKNSKGSGWGSDGYCKFIAPINQYTERRYIITPITSLNFNDNDIVCIDWDQDGYYNWGISNQKPGTCPECHDSIDSNDDNSRIGPYDEYYNETPVSPGMQVYKLGVPDSYFVQNGGCLLFQGTNPMTVIIVIRNPGNAQLNLEQEGLYQNAIVEEISDENDAYTISRKPSKIIAMGDTSYLKIALKAGALPGSVGVFKIHLNDYDKDVLSDFEFALVYEECGYLGTQLPINEYTLWDNYRTCHEDIMINRNGILEITGHVAMAENSSIFVEQGGKLIINGGTITGSCQKLWKGVDVWGDPNQPQLPYNQGMVSITNGGMIEYAEMAIETAKHFPRHDLIPSGGIVTCLDAKFKDNLVDVCLQPYQGIYSGIPQPNLSRFTRTRFETTDELYSNDYLDYSPNLAPDKHLMLKQVNGIHIEGCAFVNSSDVSDTRGIGIQSIGAGYYIEKTCKVYINPCPAYELPLFESLDYGIRAFNNTGVYTVSVDTAVFLHNHRGIFMSLVEHPTVIRSNFDLSDPGHFWITDPSIVGLYIENFTTGFQVEENHFLGEIGQNSTVGIHVLNSGPVFNEIYNNDLRYLQTGITAAGENRDGSPAGTDGLCIKCNDFTKCLNDINITPDGGIIQDNLGIAIVQGSLSTSDEPNLAAGNTFSNFEDLIYNYNNDNNLNQIHYIHHKIQSTTERVRPYEYNNLFTEEDFDAEYSKELSCPSNLDGGGLNTEIERLNVMNEGNIISLQEDTLNALIDGGNTWALDLNIQTSMPEEALPLRQSLIDESPFLSDTILKSAIAKEDVLVNAMIRDILISNPQAAKTPSVIERLYERNDTMPDYMLVEIMGGLEIYGEKEIRLRNLAPHRLSQFTALNKLNRFFKLDSSGINSADSILQIFQIYTSLWAEYQKAFIYMSGHDSIMAGSILDQIPSDYDLSEIEVETNDSYHELFDIISALDSINSIDSISLLRLLELSTENDIPGIYARNMLVSDGSLLYQEPVFLSSENYKRSEISTGDNNPQKEKNNYLNIFPNPSKSYLIIEYDLINLTGNSILNISDLSGRLIDKLFLNKQRNQFVYDNSLLTPGLYLAELTVDEKLIESVKFIVIK